MDGRIRGRHQRCQGQRYPKRDDRSPESASLHSIHSQPAQHHRRRSRALVGDSSLPASSVKTTRTKITLPSIPLWMTFRHA